jgi:hypothetical protein
MSKIVIHLFHDDAASLAENHPLHEQSATESLLETRLSNPARARTANQKGIDPMTPHTYAAICAFIGCSIGPPG